jgi:hypothetical protein
MTRNRDVLGATLRFIPGAIFGAIIGVWLVVAVRISFSSSAAFSRAR